MMMKKRGRAVRMRSILVLQVDRIEIHSILFCLLSKAKTTRKEGVGYHGEAEGGSSHINFIQETKLNE
jgi:hypothetical protein